MSISYVAQGFSQFLLLYKFFLMPVFETCQSGIQNKPLLKISTTKLAPNDLTVTNSKQA